MTEQTDKKALDFRFRVGNLEARRSPSGYEIVEWGESSCWVLAHWFEYEDGTGFYLKFVGNRPFGDKVNSQDFWVLAWLGQAILDYDPRRLE